MSHPTGIRRTDSPFNDPVQSCRFVEVDDHWFFLTREKALQGPFNTRSSAETALDIYLAELGPVSTAVETVAAAPVAELVPEMDEGRDKLNLQSYSVEELHRSTSGEAANWDRWKR